MKSIRMSAFWLAATLLFTATQAFSQSTTFGFTYTFPRVEIPGMRLLIANVNNNAAIARVTLYNPDGTAAGSTRFTLEAAAQRIFDDSDVLVPNFIGAAVVETTIPVAASSAISTADVFETAAPSVSGLDLVIPFARTASVAETTVSVFNPGTQSADVTIILGKRDGTQITGSRLTLGPKQSAHTSLNGLGSSDLNSITHVFVRSSSSILRSDRPVSAVATVRYFDNGTGIIREDAGIVQAVPSDKLSSSVSVPLFVQGMGYFTLLQVMNVSDVAQSITLTAFDQNGVPIPGSTNPVTISLPPNGCFAGNTLKLFGMTGDQEGSIAVTGGAPLTAVAMAGDNRHPNLGVIEPAETTFSTFAIQFQSVSRASFDGLSFRNLNTADAGLSLTFIANDGSTTSTAQLTIPAAGQVVRTLADILPEVEGSGFIFGTSTVPLQIVAFEGSTDVLSSLPISAAAPDFTPKTKTKFLAVGKATIADVAMPGATVRLSGPVSGTQVTDSAGAYVFRDLPPGTYGVTIELAGVQFTPQSLSFVIENDNSRENNFAGTVLAATLSSITPNSTLAGTPSLQITAKGGPFIPTSEIVFDGSVIPTTFVSETVLTAAVAGTALQLPRELSVQVRNRIGSNFSPAGTVSFVVGTPAPVITSLEGVPSEIIAGHPGFEVAVNGTGFNEGGTLEVDGVPRPYVWDGPTRVRAQIGPADLATGRYARLTVTNPGATVGPSNSALITVNNPVAGMLSLSPNKAEMKLEPNSTGLQMTINGFSFKRGAKVQVEGFAALSTTFVDSTTLIATIPADALQVGGIFKVTVSNPEPNIGSSEGQPFIVYALVPTLLSIDTGTLTFSPGPTKDTTSPIQAIVILHGSNFGKTYSAAVQSPPGDFPSCGNPPDKNPYAQLPVTRVSSTEMIATLSINCTGTYNIYVSSNQTEPGGGVSGVVSFVVNSPGTGVTPAIGSLTPPSTPVGTAFTLTINGNNFLPNALVNFGTAILKPVSVTSTAIVVNVPAYYLQEKGKIPVTVTNPGVGGTGAGQAGTSPRFFLVVN